MHGMCHHFQYFQLFQGTGVLRRPVIILLSQNHEITQKGHRGKGLREGSPKNPPNLNTDLELF